MHLGECETRVFLASREEERVSFSLLFTVSLLFTHLEFSASAHSGVTDLAAQLCRNAEPPMLRIFAQFSGVGRRPDISSRAYFCGPQGVSVACSAVDLTSEIPEHNQRDRCSVSRNAFLINLLNREFFRAWTLVANLPWPPHVLAGVFLVLLSDRVTHSVEVSQRELKKLMATQL